MGWLKLGWIFCFLLVALLRMARLLNPINIVKTASNIVMTASHRYVDVSRYLWSAFVAMGPTLWSVPFMIFSLPAMVVAWVRYWYICFRLASRYIRLSWFWWLHMISVLWNLKPRLDGQDIHGTYWMWYRADMFELKRQFKELKRLRKDIGDSYIGKTICFIWSLIAPCIFPWSC